MILCHYMNAQTMIIAETKNFRTPSFILNKLKFQNESLENKFNVLIQFTFFNTQNVSK